MEAKTTLIRGCDVANFDTLTTARRDLRIEGNRIAEIAAHIEPPHGAQVLDAKGMLALPGFVDCHTHLYQTFLKGPLDDYPITEWLLELIRHEQRMDDEARYYSALLGCLSGLRFGTTTVNEMGTDETTDTTLQAIRDSGIRAVYGTSPTDIAENELTPVKPLDEVLQTAETVCAKIERLGLERVRASIAPAGRPACPGAPVPATKAFARERGLVFHTHLAEGKHETEGVRRRFGLRGEAEALAQLGVLDEHTVLAHSIWLEDFELDILRETGATPVHCPNTNMKICDGIPKIHAMLQRGIPVALGCDGEASSSTRDMIREGRAGSYLQKVVTLDPTAMPAGTTFKMMTVNGARALQLDGVGELQAGAKADLLLVNTDNDLSLVNPDYRIGNLLYAGDGHAVDTVFCDGELLVRGGRLTRFDEAEVIAKCAEIVRRMNRGF